MKPEAPIVNNPFLGLSVEDARRTCYDLLFEAADGLPTRPSLPHEREEFGGARMYTDRAVSIMQRIEDDAKRALAAAGHDVEATFRSPSTWY